MGAQLNEGILFARRAIEANPDYPGAHARLGHLLMQAGATQEAATAYRRAVSLDPVAPDLRRFLTAAESSAPRAAPQGGQPHEGVLFALRAVEANPGYAGAYARLGHMLLHSGAVDEAVLAYRKGLALDPSAGDLQRFLSGALHIQAHPMLRKAPFDRIHAEFSSHEGVAFALAAISANPGYAGAYARLGHLLLNLGARREAASVYGQACTIDPSAADLPRFLAEASRPEAKAAPSSPARAGTKLDGQRSPAAAAKPAATAPAKRGFFRTLFESLFGS